MMRPSIWMLLALFVLLPLAAAAASFEVSPGVTLEYVLPSDRWQVAGEPPESLVAERAEHLVHELAEKGRQVTEGEARTLARRQLAGNELFIFNPATGARLEVDFSPLREGERAPSASAVAASAKYAGQSLEGEEGVSAVTAATRRTEVAGAKVAWRLEADYLLHGEKRQFVGIVGFAAPHWLFLYYTDPLRDPRDRVEMEEVLNSLAVRAGGGK